MKKSMKTLVLYIHTHIVLLNNEKEKNKSDCFTNVRPLQALKYNFGITLIALIITIIVLLILAGVTLNMVMGDSGIFSKANQAKNKTEVAQYEEELRMCILELQTDSATNGTTFNMETIKNKLVEKVKKLENTEDIEFPTEESETRLDGTYKGYKFYIDEKYVAHIEEKKIGEKTTETIITLTIKSEIPKSGYTNKAEDILITIKNPNGIKKITKEDGKELNLENNPKEWSIDYAGVDTNRTYTFIVEDISGNKETKTISVGNIDKLPPENIEVTTKIVDGGLKIEAKTEDAKSTDTDAYSGIEKYEYYLKTKENDEYKKYEEGYIQNFSSENYWVYVIAYDKANNYTKSSNIEIKNNYKSLNQTFSNGKAFSNNNSDKSNLAFDNNSSTYWDGKNVDSYIGYDFKTSVQCDTVKISQPYSMDVIRYFKIQYSDDNINYYDASDTLEFLRKKEEQTFNLNSNVGAHRYWRYKNISNYTNGEFCAISELNFLVLDSYIKTTDYINTTTEFFANNNNDKSNLAFDNNSSTYWDGKNIDSYIGCDFKTNVECNIVKINQPYSVDVIRYFKIQYSDDNINYYDASDTLEFLRKNEEQTFNLNSNVGSHRYWRYKNISNYTNKEFCTISELKFIGRVEQKR